VTYFYTQVGLGQSADGLGWIGSHEMDSWTTLWWPAPLCKMNSFSVGANRLLEHDKTNATQQGGTSARARRRNDVTRWNGIDMLPSDPLCANMTSTIKSQVHNVSQCRHRRTEQRPCVTRTNLIKIGPVVPEICSRTDRHTDTQTNTQTRSSHYSAPYRGRSKSWTMFEFLQECSKRLTLVVYLRPVDAGFWQILIAAHVEAVKLARYAAGGWNSWKHWHAAV